MYLIVNVIRQSSSEAEHGFQRPANPCRPQASLKLTVQFFLEIAFGGRANRIRR
jgi:hypothetical protein